MNYYPRYPSHYLAATLHLSMTEDGAYTRLLDWYYSNEKPIPDSAKYAITRASSSAEKQAVNTVLGYYFERVADEWVQKRVEEEIGKASLKINAAKNNGLKGGRPRKSSSSEKPTGFSTNNPLGFQNETQPITQKKAPQSPVLDQEQKQTSLVVLDENPVGFRFKDFWAIYPAKQGKKVAFEKWKRRNLDRIADQIIADVVERKRSDQKWLDGYIPMASTYVNQERWQDDIASKQAVIQQPSKTRQGIENLMRGVNGHESDRTGNQARLEQTGLLELGPHSGDGHARRNR